MKDPNDLARNLYLDLMKHSLLNLIYGDTEVIPAAPRSPLKQSVVKAIRSLGLEVVHRKQFDPEIRKSGRDWPTDGQTMLSLARLENVQFCAEQALQNNVPGDFIEAGVWRGGASILMQAVLKSYGIADRKVYVADSFAGLPPPSKDYPQDAAIPYHTMPELAISLETVKGNFARYGLLNEQVEFLKGWFRDTLPVAPIERLAVVRLDGDMYESTMDGLVALYPKLSVGGYVILDDYVMLEASRQAALDYRQQHAIDEPVIEIDFAGAYWQKTKNI